MEIFDKLGEEFDKFLGMEWIEIFVAFFGLIGLFLYMSLWFLIFLIYMPLNWLWLNKIRGRSK